MSHDGLLNQAGELIFQIKEVGIFKTSAKINGVEGTLFYTNFRLVWVGIQRGGAKVSLGLSLSAVVRTAVKTAASKSKKHEVYTVIPNSIINSVGINENQVQIGYNSNSSKTGSEQVIFTFMSQQEARSVQQTIITHLNRENPTMPSTHSVPQQETENHLKSYLDKLTSISQEEFQLRRELEEFDLDDYLIYKHFVLSQMKDTETLLRIELGEFNKSTLVKYLQTTNIHPTTLDN